MRIRQKLIIGDLAVAALVAGIGYLGIAMCSTAKEGFRMAANHTIPAIKALEVLRFAGLRIVSSTSEYGFIRAEKEVMGEKIAESEEEEERLIGVGVDLYNWAVKQYEDLLTGLPSKNGSLLQDIRRNGLTLQQTSTELVNLKRQGVSGLEVLQKKEAFERTEKAFLAALDAAISHEGKEFETKQAILESTLEVKRNLGIAATVLSVIAAIIIGTFISRSISKPLAILTDAAGEIGRGNLHVRVGIESADEIGQLGVSFDKMRRDLRRYQNHLEELVEGRTSELRVANEQLKQEISERNRADQALRQSENSYRTLAQNLPGMVYRLFIRENNRMQFFNDMVVVMTGNKVDELTEGKVCSIEAGIHPDDQTHVRATVKNAITEDKAFEVEYRYRHKDGDTRYFSERGRPIHGPDGKPLYVDGVIFDITDRKRTEEELRLYRRHLEELVEQRTAELMKANIELQHAQKLKAVADLAGGIAHQFNNALVGISGNIELLQMDLPYDENIDKYIERMKASTRRMANLTDQLLAYARGGKYEPKTISLNDLVDGTVPLIQPSIGPAVRVEKDLNGDIFHVEADLPQIQMVLSAVLNNASEAMEGRGRIRIITRNEKIDQEFVKTHPDLKPGHYVCLAIEDEGKGMDEETRLRVFDPFFTTKFQGRGLGMAAAYGIIKNHGGAILVDSELGKGTVVSIYLPAMEVKVEEGKKTKTDVTTGTGTILVIEDEDVVIDVIGPMLERLGYRVLLAKTGKDAVDIAKSFDGPIDLAILDIVLPDIGARELYPLIVEARPNLKVIVCSGYDINGPAQEILDAGAQAFIKKPFSFETLSKKLNIHSSLNRKSECGFLNSPSP